MHIPRVLVVDDEPDLRELVEITLSRMEVACDKAESLQAAREFLATGHYFLCLADMRLSDGDGIDLVRHIQQYHPNLPVAVITAFGNVEGAVNTLKAGAFDYVSKPVNLAVLRGLVQTALALSNPKEVTGTAHLQLIGASPLIAQLQARVVKLARSQAPVFISGASGTGKELVARLIHQHGPRAQKPFVPVNCGAIPLELMESEFFGHKKGSFTGATVDKIGLFQAAEGGTLFLDEVADLPLAMQVKLLRAIQEKAVRPIGEQREVSIDVRILSASHKNLKQLVTQGMFREDLFYRINVIELPVPTLAERREDIPLMVDHILKQLCAQHGITFHLTPACEQALFNYNFPGNVRELENILERATTLCEHNTIELDDLHLPVSSSSSSTDSVVLPDLMDDQERELIVQALDRHKWNRTAAAKELGITFRQLRYRLKKLDVS